MKKIFIILSLLLTLSYTANQIEKLKFGCDIGDEKACQKLTELIKVSETTPKSDYTDDEYDSIVCDKNVLKTYPNITKQYSNVVWSDIKSSFTRNGFKKRGASALDALRWMDMKVEPSKYEVLKEMGVTTPSEAKKWICTGAYGNGAGFDWDIAKWQRNGIKTADEFIAYKKARLSEAEENEKRRNAIK